MAVDLSGNPAAVVLSAIALLLSFVLAIVVVRVAPPTSANRRLAILLAADGAFSATNIINAYLAPEEASSARIAEGALVVFEALAQLAFVATLDAPFARPFAGRRGIWILGGIGAAVMALVVYSYAVGRSVLRFGNIEGAAWVLLALTSAMALAATIVAFRRTEAATLGHRRAGAALLAFLARDLILVFSVVGWGVADVRGSPVLKLWSEGAAGIALALFVVILTYGMLRTQLFDIDLRVKLGISRATAASVALAVVFVISKLVEAYASRNLGFVAGATAAGLLLFAAPRLNKLGDKVANTALPKVQPTSEYLAYKKLEVYRAAVEAAQETGGITQKDRASLDRLRAKLALSEPDARAIEAELLPAVSS